MKAQNGCHQASWPPLFYHQQANEHSEQSWWF